MARPGGGHPLDRRRAAREGPFREAGPVLAGPERATDAAFAQGLYGTRLRLDSWASVVLPELPGMARGRGFFRCQLASACAKGRNGYPYWMPLAVLHGILGYAEGARAAAVRRAQAAGRYDKADPVLLAGATRTTALLETSQGGTRQKAWNDLGPDERIRLFRQTPQGLEPVALWLNEDGLPRDGHGWHHTFDTANARVASLGLDGFTCSPHLLRHSMALKWFAIGKLVHVARLEHLTHPCRRCGSSPRSNSYERHPTKMCSGSTRADNLGH